MSKNKISHAYNDTKSETVEHASHSHVIMNAKLVTEQLTWAVASFRCSCRETETLNSAMARTSVG